MSSLPKSKWQGLTAVNRGDQVVLSRADGTEAARLSVREHDVFRLADGGRTADAIAGELELGDAGPVWKSLDRLFDLGLLEARINPPAGEPSRSRRAILKDVALVGGALGLAAAAAPALAAEQMQKITPEASEQKRKVLATSAESDHKSQETKAKHSAYRSSAEEERSKSSQESDAKHSAYRKSAGEERSKSSQESDAKHGAYSRSAEEQRFKSHAQEEHVKAAAEEGHKSQ